MAQVYDESRKENLTRQGMSVTRVLRATPYSQRGLITRRLLGGVALVQGRLIRFFPARDPWLRQCFCESVDIEGVGAYLGGTGGAGILDMSAQSYYEQGARLTCTYKTPVFDQNQVSNSSPSGDQQGDSNQELSILNVAYDFSAQQLTLPNQYYGFSGGPGQTATALLAKTQLNQVKTIPQVALTVTRDLVMNVPLTAITQLVGRVNGQALLLLGKIYPISTLRFDGANTTQKVTNEGVGFYQTTYKFAIQPTYDKREDGNPGFVGWNRVFNPTTAQWEYVVALNDATRLIYLQDQGNINGALDVKQTFGVTVVSGFNLLFDARAK